MEVAKIKVSGTYARTVYTNPITAGMIGAEVAIVYTDPVWDGLAKTVVFQGAGTKDVMTQDQLVTIPADVIAQDHVHLRVGVYGVNAESVLAIPTLWAELGTVQPGADPSGDITTDPSLPVWAQLQAMIGDLDDLDTDLKINLVAAVNEALRKGSALDAAAVRQIVTDYLTDNPPKGEPGPAGPQGEKGDTGPAGPQGEKGDTGPAGPQGENGDTGQAGPQGEKGDTGPAGPQGEKGDTGPAGPQGEKGDTGPAGPQGEKGDTGPAGPQGVKGDTGPAGPQGEKGDTGPAGPQGEKGDTGRAGPKGEKGDTGAQGPQGEKGDTGATGPAGKSAYDAAKAGGYTDSEANFYADLAAIQSLAAELAAI